MIKSSGSGVTPAGLQSHSNISCTTSGNLISLSFNQVPELLERANEMYDKPHIDLALGKSTAVVTFIIFIVVFIIKKVYPQSILNKCILKML